MAAMGCSGAGGCPRVFVTRDGDVVVQGYEVESIGLAKPPEGERQVTLSGNTWAWLAHQVEAAKRDPFATFTHSAFRLETLPQYLVPVEAERFAAFREGRPLPPWPAESEAWFHGIAYSTAAGKSWSRVHVVDRPLSDYTRFELVCYEDNGRAGEEVRIAERGGDPDLDTLREDFWLFDAETTHAVALLMKYADDGEWLGYWRTEDPAVILECRRHRAIALAHSVPLAEFTASVGSR